MASELMEIEILRRLNLMRLDGSINDEKYANFVIESRKILDSLDIVLLSRPILNRAKLPISVRVRTLDLLHLCTALLWKEKENEPLSFLTHDKELGLAAISLGFE